MTDQKSLSLSSKYAETMDSEAISLVPKEKQFDQCYVVHRINLKKLFVSEQTAKMIIGSISEGKKFISLGGIFFMLNTIASIEPLPLRNKQEWEKIMAHRDEVFKRLEEEENV